MFDSPPRCCNVRLDPEFPENPHMCGLIRIHPHFLDFRCGLSALPAHRVRLPQPIAARARLNAGFCDRQTTDDWPVTILDCQRPPVQTLDGKQPSDVMETPCLYFVRSGLFVKKFLHNLLHSALLPFGFSRLRGPFRKGNKPQLREIFPLSRGDHVARSARLFSGNRLVAGLGSHWVGVRANITLAFRFMERIE